MGEILVHEFITLDGVIEDPSFTFGFSFDPKMGTAIAGIMGRARRSCWDAVRTSCSHRRGPGGQRKTTPALRS